MVPTSSTARKVTCVQLAVLADRPPVMRSRMKLPLETYQAPPARRGALGNCGIHALVFCCTKRTVSPAGARLVTNSIKSML